MKNKIYSIYLKIISGCLILLGFNSCDSNDESGGDGWVEYGSPSATYKVIGEVVSAEDEMAIQNIQVVITSMYEEEGDTTYTDGNGKFEIKKYSFPTLELVVSFEDIDGEKNGLFINKKDTIDLTEITYVGGDSWYKGHVDFDMKVIKLDPKEPEEPENPEIPGEAATN